jgi:hypothetical protein
LPNLKRGCQTFEELQNFSELPAILSALSTCSPCPPPPIAVTKMFTNLYTPLHLALHPLLYQIRDRHPHAQAP